ncbi:hypothetical protein LTR53_011537, partial [Teratosphaeriaceae sp. CCFEE 6253]
MAKRPFSSINHDSPAASSGQPSSKKPKQSHPPLRRPSRQSHNALPQRSPAVEAQTTPRTNTEPYAPRTSDASVLAGALPAPPVLSKKARKRRNARQRSLGGPTSNATPSTLAASIHASSPAVTGPKSLKDAPELKTPSTIRTHAPKIAKAQRPRRETTAEVRSLEPGLLLQATTTKLLVPPSKQWKDDSSEHLELMKAADGSVMVDRECQTDIYGQMHLQLVFAPLPRSLDAPPKVNRLKLEAVIEHGPADRAVVKHEASTSFGVIHVDGNESGAKGAAIRGGRTVVKPLAPTGSTDAKPVNGVVAAKKMNSMITSGDKILDDSDSDINEERSSSGSDAASATAGLTQTNGRSRNEKKPRDSSTPTEIPSKAAGMVLSKPQAATPDLDVDAAVEEVSAASSDGPSDEHREAEASSDDDDAESMASSSEEDNAPDTQRETRKLGATGFDVSPRLRSGIQITNGEHGDQMIKAPHEVPSVPLAGASKRQKQSGRVASAVLEDGSGVARKDETSEAAAQSTDEHGDDVELQNTETDKSVDESEMVDLMDTSSDRLPKVEGSQGEVASQPRLDRTQLTTMSTMPVPASPPKIDIGTAQKVVNLDSSAGVKGTPLFAGINTRVSTVGLQARRPSLTQKSSMPHNGKAASTATQPVDAREAFRRFSSFVGGNDSSEEEASDSDSESEAGGDKSQPPRSATSQAGTGTTRGLDGPAMDSDKGQMEAPHVARVDDASQGKIAVSTIKRESVAKPEETPKSPILGVRSDTRRDQIRGLGELSERQANDGEPAAFGASNEDMGSGSEVEASQSEEESEESQESEESEEESPDPDVAREGALEHGSLQRSTSAASQIKKLDRDAKGTVAPKDGDSSSGREDDSDSSSEDEQGVADGSKLDEMIFKSSGQSGANATKLDVSDDQADSVRLVDELGEILNEPSGSETDPEGENTNSLAANSTPGNRNVAIALNDPLQRAKTASSSPDWMMSLQQINNARASQQLKGEAIAASSTAQTPKQRPNLSESQSALSRLRAAREARMAKPEDGPRDADGDLADSADETGHGLYPQHKLGTQPAVSSPAPSGRPESVDEQPSNARSSGPVTHVDTEQHSPAVQTPRLGSLTAARGKKSPNDRPDQAQEPKTTTKSQGSTSKPPAFDKLKGCPFEGCESGPWATRGGKNTHIRRHHKDQPPLSHRCVAPGCAHKPFTSEAGLAQHVARVHQQGVEAIPSGDAGDGPVKDSADPQNPKQGVHSPSNATEPDLLPKATAGAARKRAPTAMTEKLAKKVKDNQDGTERVVGSSTHGHKLTDNAKTAHVSDSHSEHNGDAASPPARQPKPRAKALSNGVTGTPLPAISGEHDQVPEQPSSFLAWGGSSGSGPTHNSEAAAAATLSKDLALADHTDEDVYNTIEEITSGVFADTRLLPASKLLHSDLAAARMLTTCEYSVSHPMKSQTSRRFVKDDLIPVGGREDVVCYAARVTDYENGPPQHDGRTSHIDQHAQATTDSATSPSEMVVQAAHSEPALPTVDTSAASTVEQLTSSSEGVHVPHQEHVSHPQQDPAPPAPVNSGTPTSSSPRTAIDDEKNPNAESSLLLLTRMRSSSSSLSELDHTPTPPDDAPGELEDARSAQPPPEADSDLGKGETVARKKRRQTGVTSKHWTPVKRKKSPDAGDEADRSAKDETGLMEVPTAGDEQPPDQISPKDEAIMGQTRKREKKRKTKASGSHERHTTDDKPNEENYKADQSEPVLETIKKPPRKRASQRKAGGVPTSSEPVGAIDETIGAQLDDDTIGEPAKKPTKKKRKATSTKSPHFERTHLLDRVDLPSPNKTRVAGVSSATVPSIHSPYFGIIQEKLWQEPFWLLVAVTLLNRTTGRAAIPIFWDIKARYVSPQGLAAAEVEDITGMIARLGFQNQRAVKLVAMGRVWIAQPPEVGKRYRAKDYPGHGDHAVYNRRKTRVIEGDSKSCGGALEIAHLPGCGAYAYDSWRIFCRDVLRGVAEDYNGKGAARVGGVDNGAEEAAFEPEWKRVLPTDKELRATLRWMWLREGWIWEHETGGRRRATGEEMERAVRGEMDVPDAKEGQFAARAAAAVEH